MTAKGARKGHSVSLFSQAPDAHLAALIAFDNTQLIISTVTFTGNQVRVCVNRGFDICSCIPADNSACGSA